MMSRQQQNPPASSQSLLLREMGSEKPNTQAHVKPFSIRQYVVASRQRNILQNWPFPEKYLQMCLNRGIKDVLPPFEEPQTTSLLADQSLKGSSSNLMMHSQLDDTKDIANNFCKDEVEYQPQNMKHECDLIFSDDGEERCKITKCHSQQDDINVSFHNLSHESAEEDALTNPTSSNCGVDHKITSPYSSSKVEVKDKHNKRRRRGRGRGRCKKRAMVDILAVARRCTLEEICRMNRFSTLTAETTTVVEGRFHHQQLVPSDNNVSSKSQLTTGVDYCRKLVGSEDH